MGILEFLGDVAKGVTKNIVDKAQEIKNFKLLYSNLSDEVLISKLKKSTNSEEKMALMSLLKERGYGNKED